jgi:hypothetical protein
MNLQLASLLASQVSSSLGMPVDQKGRFEAMTWHLVRAQWSLQLG